MRETVLTPSEAEQVRELLRVRGDLAGSDALGIGRQTAARAVARLSLRRGTVALIRARLAELAQPQAAGIVAADLGAPAPEAA